MAERSLKLLIAGDASGALKAFGAAGDAGETFGSKIASISKKAKIALAGISLGATAILKSSMDAYGEFEQTLNVLKVNAGASGKQMESLSALALKMGADTVFSASEAADAMLELAKGGLKVADIQGGALASTLNLAATEGMGLADASTIIVQAMNTFGIKAKDTAKVADVLAAGSVASTAGVADLAEALKYVGSTASNLKVPFNETITALAAMNNAGIDSTTAGTSLNRMLLGLVPTTVKASNEMDRLGLSFIDAKGNALPMHDIVERLQKGYEGMGNDAKIASLKAIFGVEGMRAAMVLMAGDSTKAFDDLAKAIDANGVALAMAKARMEGNKGAVEQWKGSVDTLKILLAMVLAPLFTKLASKATELVNALMALPPGFRQVAAGGLVALAALGPLVAMVTNLQKAFGLLVANPIVAYLLALAAAFTFLYVKVEAFRDVVNWAFRNISNFIEFIFDVIVIAIVGPIALILVAWQRWGDNLVAATKTAFGLIGKTIGFLLDLALLPIYLFITTATAAWNRYKDDILRITAILWETLRGVIDGGVRMAKGIIDVFLGVLTLDWTRVWNGLKGIVSGAITAVVSIITGAGSLILGAARAAFDKVVEGAGQSFQLLKAGFLTLPTLIGTWVKGAGSWLLKAGRDIVAGLWEGIKSGWKEFFVGGSSLAKKIETKERKEADSHSPSMLFYDVGVDIVAGLALGISSSEHLATNAIASITGSMAGEAARNGHKVTDSLFAAMAGEAARNGTTVYTPLIASMAGEAARNGNKAAKPLFAAMAGEAARNGANQIAGALRDGLERQAKDLGYDLGAAIANSITEKIDDVEDYFKKFMDRIDQDYGSKLGPSAQAAARDLSKLTISQRYAKAAGGDAAWWESQLGNLADWNSKMGNTDVQVRAFAPSVNGNLLTDKSGNPIYADETDKITEALNALIPQMATGGIVTAPTLAMIGESGPEAIIPLGSSALAGGGDVYLTVTGSVVTERDLVETVRKALIVAQQQGKTLVV